MRVMIQHMRTRLRGGELGKALLHDCVEGHGRVVDKEPEEGRDELRISQACKKGDGGCYKGKTEGW